jgi:hypothetical protein
MKKAVFNLETAEISTLEDREENLISKVFLNGETF